MSSATFDACFNNSTKTQYLAKIPPCGKHTNSKRSLSERTAREQDIASYFKTVENRQGRTGSWIFNICEGNCRHMPT